ncbi:FAD/NAD(P)-binding protein [Citricoccus sp. SGAir0253]|uniref:FAD/NAD(P)-binding protein n=1 Tax=Citricoccus sp. SGAir0253 TaxID=2567881 RepID=UPI0010CD6C2B|nr:FAD/NAD(P)-binding protein [Citricoccus sp. SGAir0253]QCU78826.1 FAD/NAD(P)-binding protein [Citricoccus sp. SGAir0253]
MPPSPATPDRATIAVVGAGPRGTSFLERLLAVVEEAAECRSGQPGPAPGGRPVDVVVLDPQRPGPGRVWRTDQSPQFLMNTPSFFPTAAAAGTPGLRPSSVGLTFDQWRMANPDRAGDLDRSDYPPRAVYGLYLEDLYGEVTAALEAHDAVGTVSWVPAEVVGLIPGPAGGATLTLDDGATLVADAVVLGLGHVPARPTREQQLLSAAATELGLHYRGPHLPAELDWDTLPAGEDVLVRGMGLNFFDAMAQLTLGRGGTFEPTGEGPGRTLRYVPSGREPVLHPASRRGTCYLPKAELDAFVPHAVSLKYLTREAVERLQAEHGVLDFAVHLWPLVHRDVVRAYYFTLVRTRPKVLGGAERAGEFLAALVGQFEAAGRGEPVTARHAQELLAEYQPGMPFLDIRALGRPFERRVYDSGEEYQREVAGFLEGVCAEAAAGEDSPLMVAIGTLHAARLLVKRLVAERRITDASRRRDVSGWFESLVEGLASGPPLLRVEQLLALARAGLVRFVGPDPQFEPDAGRARFTVSSPQVGGGEEAQDVQSGTWLVEAMMPANRVQQSASPLVSSMLAAGTAVPYTVEDEDGELLPGRGFDVTERPYRLRAADGTVHGSVFVLGLQLASVQWGTAIAAEAGEDPDGRARTLGDADAAARAAWGIVTS